MVAKGYFVIADITGYTAYLTQSGLEDAQGVLNVLFEGLLDAIQPPLQVSNFQGDAILAYTPEGSAIQGQTWRPFEYFTVEGVGLGGINYSATYRLSAAEQGSRFSWYWSHPPDVAVTEVEPAYRAACQDGIEKLRGLIEADQTVSERRS